MMLLCGNLFFSQADTIGAEASVKKVKLLFAFDARRSFVLDNKVRFNGIKIGAEIKEKHRVGIGFYGLSSPVQFIGRVDPKIYPDATDTVFFNFNYVSMFYEYVWLRTKRWELSTPMHLGAGGIELSYLDTTGLQRIPFLKGGSLLLAYGGSAQFKVFRWFALGTGAGYRSMLTKEVNIQRPLNALYYQFQVKILLGELYRMTFKRKELEEW